MVLDSCVALLQVGGLLVLASLHLLSASSAYLVIGSACAVTATAWLVSSRESFSVSTEDAWYDFQANWTFGKWVFASGLLWALGTNASPWLLTLLQGTAATGEWGACLSVIALANVPLMGAQNVLGPRIARVNATGGIVALRSFTFKASVITGVIMAVLCCALFCFGGRVLVLMYGAKYSGNGSVVGVLALNLVATSVAFAYSRALFAIERADVDFKANLVHLVTLLTVGLWTIAVLGPLGAAWALFLANAASSAVRCASFIMISNPMIQRAHP